MHPQLNLCVHSCFSYVALGLRLVSVLTHDLLERHIHTKTLQARVYGTVVN